MGSSYSEAKGKASLRSSSVLLKVGGLVWPRVLEARALVECARRELCCGR